MANFSGTAGKDFIHVLGDGHVTPGGYTNNTNATSDNDNIDISQGGADIVFAGDGDDAIILGSKLTSADQIDGEGGDSDRVFVDGDYSAGIVFAANTLVNVEQVSMAAGHDYKFTTNNANLAALNFLFFDAHLLGAANHLTLDASAETNGSILARGGAGDDVVTGGNFRNTFYGGDGGNDKFTGGADTDNFFLVGALTAKDRITGGGSFDNDSIDLQGDYSGGLKLGAKTLVGIEEIDLSNNFTDYKITLNDATVAAGEGLFVDGTALFSANRLVLNGAAETDGQLVLFGGNGKDVLTGGGGDDTIIGGQGKDTITPGGGADTVRYGLGGATESTGAQHDTVVGFDFAHDVFNLPVGVTGIDTKINHGTLSGADFDADMTAAVTAAKLGIHHAVLFTADAGTLTGHTFLIVDENGVAGYQAGADYVIELKGALHTGAIDIADFE